jgi:hypothetical protein
MRTCLSVLGLSAMSLVTACEQYTEKTSPCFGRNGEPVVARAAMSFAATAIVSDNAHSDCTFEALPRPE